MKKYALLSIILMTLAGCGNHYAVEGESSVEELEGRTLELKVFDGNELKTIDSCKVVHGKFSFKGKLDSVMMANLFMDNESLMPVVLDGEGVTIDIGQMEQKIGGSPLNDSLYHFIQKKSKLEREMAELPHLESKMIMEGIDHDEILNILNNKAHDIGMQNDRLVTRFIIDNATNVMGPGVFMIMTSEMEYPVLTPQIEEILATVPESFKENPYVKEYLRVANENMQLLRE